MRILSLPLAFASLTFAAVPHKFTAGTAAKADSVNANFEYLDNALKAKANQAGLDSLVSRVNSSPTVAGKASQGSVDTLKQLVSTKADTSELSAVKKSLSGLATTSSLTDALKLKANQAGLDSLVSRVNSSPSAAGKASQGSVDTLKQIVATKADMSEVSSIKTSISGLATTKALNDSLAKKVNLNAISDMATKYWANGTFAPTTVSNDVATLKTSTATLSTDVTALKTTTTTLSGEISALQAGKADASALGAKADSTRALMIRNGTVFVPSDVTIIVDKSGVPNGWATYMAEDNFGITGPSAVIYFHKSAEYSGIALTSSSRAGDYDYFVTNGSSVLFPGKVIHQKDDSIAGNLRVAGTIKAYTTGSIVPDYVFEPDYKLAPLSEVEAYTQENKHLPEVPSAAEIEKGGLDLTQMNLALLKKVEELTLHAIAQQKQIEAQNARIQTLESKLPATP